jgi:hypothetical protein
LNLNFEHVYPTEPGFLTAMMLKMIIGVIPHAAADEDDIFHNPEILPNSTGLQRGQFRTLSSKSSACNRLALIFSI